MKKNSLTQSLLTTTVILLGFNQTVAAHTIGTGILGGTAAATDYYQIDCTTTLPSTKTHHLFVNIQDKNGDSNLVGVTAFSANAGINLKASTTVDPIGGTTTPAAAALSPNISVVGNEGTYVLAVFKTGLTAQQYSLTAHCEDINGTETNARGLVTTAPSTLISNQ